MPANKRTKSNINGGNTIMADDLETQFSKKIYGFLSTEGPVPEQKVDEALKTSGLATVVLENGMTPMKYAENAGRTWMMRKIALTSHLEKTPDLAEKFAAETKIIDDDKSITGQQYWKLRTRLEDAYVQQIPEKTGTPELEKYRDHVKLSAWKNENYKNIKPTNTYIHLAAVQNRDDILTLLASDHNREFRQERILKPLVEVLDNWQKPKDLTHTDPEVVGAMICGYAPMHQYETPLRMAAANGADKTFPLLLQLGATPATKMSNSITAAHAAAAHGRLDFLKLLKAKDKNSIDGKNESRDDHPIDIAVLAQKKDVVEFYIAELKATIKDPRELQRRLDKTLTTALMPDMAQLLLDAGANPNSKTTPALQWLGTHKANSLAEDYHIPTIKTDHMGTYKCLLAHKTKDQQADVNNCHALTCGIQHHVDNAVLLDMMEKTTDLKKQAPDEGWRTPLHMAVKWNNETLVDAIIKKDPKTTEVLDYDNDTPLMYAICRSDLKMVKTLLPHTDLDKQHGASKNTAFSTAMRRLTSMSQLPEASFEDALEILKLVKTQKNATLESTYFGTTQTPAAHVQEEMGRLQPKIREGTMTPQDTMRYRYMHKALQLLPQRQAAMDISKPQMAEEVLQKALVAAGNIPVTIAQNTQSPLRLPEIPAELLLASIRR